MIQDEDRVAALRVEVALAERALAAAKLMQRPGSNVKAIIRRRAAEVAVLKAALLQAQAGAAR